MENPTLIVDGSYLMYRAYHQKAARTLSSSKGLWTGGAYVFLKSLKYALEMTHPGKLVVVWDGSKSRRRMQLYPEYKANRKKIVDDVNGEEVDVRGVVQTQIEMLEVAFRSLGVRICFHPQMEGDDLVYLLSILQPNSVIVSEDKDMLAMIRPTVSVYQPMKGAFVDLTAFTEENGYDPRWHVINRAIEGDTSDNIDGVKDVGKKTAAEFCKIVQETGSVAAAVRTVREGKFGKRLKKITDPESIAVIKRNIDLMDCSREPFSKETVQWARAIVEDPSMTSGKSYETFLDFCHKHEFNSLMSLEWFSAFDRLR